MLVVIDGDFLRHVQGGFQTKLCRFSLMASSFLFFGDGGLDLGLVLYVAQRNAQATGLKRAQTHTFTHRLFFFFFWEDRVKSGKVHLRVRFRLIQLALKTFQN